MVRTALAALLLSGLTIGTAAAQTDYPGVRIMGGTGTAAPGTSAASASSVQGVTNGVPVSTTPGPLAPYDLDVATVTTGGTAVTALAAGNAAKGGFIKAVSAILCIRDSTGTAGTVDGVAGTTCIAVGQTYTLPPQVGAISVNSTTAGAIIGGRGYK